MEYLRADVVRNVQGRIIQTYGGLPGVRDEGALESAIARPANVAHYNDTEDIPLLGASLSWALLKGHAFNDGNKRIAFAALVMFFELNGYLLTCSEVEETAVMIRTAASEMLESDFSSWVSSVAIPKV